MTKQFMEKTLEFILSTSDIDMDNIIDIGTFNKYTISIIKNDKMPCYYLSYQADNEFDDVLYRFRIDEYDMFGMGGFTTEDMNDFFMFLRNGDTWSKIIEAWNKYNPENQVSINCELIDYTI